MGTGCDKLFEALSAMVDDAATSVLKKSEFNGTSTHLLDGYISANQIFFFYILE